MRVNWRRITIGISRTAVAALALAGCSVSSSPVGNPGPSFCQNYIDAVTAKLQQCQGGSAAALQALFQTTNICNGITLDLAAGKVVFAENSASACLREIDALDCGSLAASSASPTGYPSDCGRVFQGTVPIGAACYPLTAPPAQECVSGSHCVADTQCPGVCQPDGTSGQACDLTIGGCAAGLTCTYGYAATPTCTALPPDVQVGAPCAGPADCGSANVGLICEGKDGPIDGFVSTSAGVSGTCQKPPVSGPCNTASECSSESCSSTAPGTTSGVCLPPKVVGDPCVKGARQCGVGAYCGSASRCVELPVVGQSCAGTSGEGTDCIDGFCNPLTKTCMPFLGAGAGCQSQATLVPQQPQQCDPINTTCSPTWGVCLPACAPGSSCGGSGQICCANEICAAGLACSVGTCQPAAPPSDGGHPPVDAGAPQGFLLVPDAMGVFDGTNPAGVVGYWWAGADDYGSYGQPGGGNCPQAGFPDSECSVFDTPIPGQLFAPAPNGRGMCTRGTAATVLNSDAGQPFYTAIWGALIGFDLNHPVALDGGAAPPNAGLSGLGQYDAPAHGITGISFDIDSPPPETNFRVGFKTLGTEESFAYWGGKTMLYSPVPAGGRYQLHWSEVGGPYYLSVPPPFDPSKLESVVFFVTTSAAGPVPFMFCISNLILLTD
jgi:hypothetical protein